MQAIRGYGEHLGMLMTAELTGTSLRVTGAQRMAKAGLTPEQIKTFGRWGSSKQMAKYTRES